MPDVAELSPATAGHFGVFPPMLTNPSQDYWHLKSRRAHLESQNYKGIRAPSSRSTAGGKMVVLFDDQSANVAGIDPAVLQIRLLQPNGAAFNNHVLQSLDFEACEVEVTSNPVPPWASAYASATTVQFNH